MDIINERLISLCTLPTNRERGRELQSMLHHDSKQILLTLVDGRCICIYIYIDIIHAIILIYKRPYVYLSFDRPTRLQHCLTTIENSDNFNGRDIQ